MDLFYGRMFIIRRPISRLFFSSRVPNIRIADATNNCKRKKEKRNLKALFLWYVY